MIIHEQRRFLQLAAGVWVAIAVGSGYAFGIVSNELKDRFSIGQAGMTTISTVGYILGSFSFPGGISQDYFGPRPTLAFGGLCCSTGFLLLALTFWGAVPGSVPLLSTAYGLINMGNGWSDQGALLTNLFVFPINRGDVIALQKTFVGLGSSLMALWYSGFFSKHYGEFCLFLSIFALTVSLFGSAIIRLPPYQLTNRERKQRSPISDAEANELRLWEELYYTKKPPAWRMRISLISLLVTFIVVTAMSVTRAFVPLSAETHLIISIFTVFCVLSFVLMFAFPESGRVASCCSSCDDALERGSDSAEGVVDPEKASLTFDPSHEEESAGQPNESTPLDLNRCKRYASTDGLANSFTPQLSLQSPSGLEPRPLLIPESLPETPLKPETGASNTAVESEHQYPNSFMKNLRSEPIVWLIWSWNFLTEGAGLVLFANAAQIYRSINGNVFDEDYNAFCVAMVGIGGAVGRIAAGKIDNLLRAHGMHCTIFFPLPPATIAISLVGFLVLPSLAAPFLFAFASFGFGICQAVKVLGSRLMFRQDVGKHYSFFSTATMVGIILFNRLLFGEMYEKEARAQQLSPFCSGIMCIAVSFGVMIGLCAIGVGVGVAAHKMWLRQCNAERQESASHE
jgi:MFS family permease